MQIELGSLIAAGRVKTSIIGQDVLVTRNEVSRPFLGSGLGTGFVASCSTVGLALIVILVLLSQVSFEK